MGSWRASLSGASGSHQPMPVLTVLVALLAAETRPYTSPRPATPEYGFTLSAQDARDGWISLMDGTTSYGWADVTVRGGRLVAGATTSAFGDFEFRIETDAAGDLVF